MPMVVKTPYDQPVLLNKKPKRNGYQTKEIPAKMYALFLSTILVAAPPLCTGDVYDSTALTVWLQSTLIKVFPDTKPPADHRPGAYVLRAARGEREAVQLLLAPKRELADVWIIPSALTGPAVIPASQISVLWVAYVPVKTPSGPHGTTGLHPDPLPAKNLAPWKPGVCQAAWITVSVPRGIPAGLYHGTLFVASGTDRIEVPLGLEVWDFDLPQTRKLIVESSFRSSALHAYGEDGFPAVQRYLRNMAQHGVNACEIPRPPVTLTEDGKVRVDLVRLEEYGKFCHSVGFVHLRMPIVWIARTRDHRWPSDASWTVRGVDGRAQRLAIFERDRINPRFEKAFASYLRQMVDCFQQNGWYEHTGVRFFDEADLRDAPTVARIRQLNELIGRVAPGLPVMQTRPPVPELLDLSRIWICNADMLDEFAEPIATARSRGHVIGVYHNTIPMIDYTPLRVRTFPWGIWTKRLDQVGAWWNITNWLNDPWTETVSYPRRNGDGVLVYPPRNKDESGPITSIRWETFRDGLEDYDYLTLLENLAAKRSEAAIAQQLLSEARTVMPQFPRVRGETEEVYWTDAARLEDLRARIAAEIVRLGQP